MMAPPPGKKPGRPVTRTQGRAGDYVGFRTPRVVKEKLERHALAGGRSLSTEVQFRLEQSLRNDSALEEAENLAYGVRAAALLRLLGRAIRGATDKPEDADWIDDPNAYERVVTTVRIILEALRPGEPPPPSPEEEARRTAGIALLLLVTDANPESAWAATREEMRKRLGAAAWRRLANWRSATLSARHLTREGDHAR